MILTWNHIGATVTAAFLASLVEFVEALTVVLAVGTTRGWSGALSGAGAALGVLLLLVAVLGPALTLIPLALIQVAVGALLLLFGLRWLRKAILRAAGVLALHDEAATFEAETAALRGFGGFAGGWDKLAFATSFKITTLEGVEVVFIVVALGAGGAGLLVPASLAALAALLTVVLLGVAVHGPLARVPENTLKFAVGVVLTAFGAFWFGEGLGAPWPGADWSILALIAGFGALALACVPLCRQAARPRGVALEGGAQ